MTDRAKQFITTYDYLIDDSDWEALLIASHEEAALRNQTVREVVRAIEEALNIDIQAYQEKVFLDRLKEALAKGEPSNSYYRTEQHAIRLKSWLLSPFWTNMYGLYLDDAVGVCIDNYNVEETPDDGIIMWID